MGKLKIHASLQESLPEAEILIKNWSWYLEFTRTLSPPPPVSLVSPTQYPLSLYLDLPGEYSFLQFKFPLFKRSTLICFSSSQFQILEDGKPTGSFWS